MTEDVLEALPFGFRWGPLMVTRLISDEKFGYVLEIRTEHKTLEVRVSPKGRRIEAWPEGEDI